MFIIVIVHNNWAGRQAHIKARPPPPVNNTNSNNMNNDNSTHDNSNNNINTSISSNRINSNGRINRINRINSITRNAINRLNAYQGTPPGHFWGRTWSRLKCRGPTPWNLDHRNLATLHHGFSTQHCFHYGCLGITNINTHTHMCVYICLYMYVCIHIYIYIYLQQTITTL